MPAPDLNRNGEPLDRSFKATWRRISSSAADERARLRQENMAAVAQQAAVKRQHRQKVVLTIGISIAITAASFSAASFCEPQHPFVSFGLSVLGLLSGTFVLAYFGTLVMRAALSVAFAIAIGVSLVGLKIVLALFSFLHF